MKVTPYNVGRYCLSEDDCIQQGIDFAAYERGVADAAKAFGAKTRPSPQASQPLSDEQIEKIVNDYTHSDHGYDIWTDGKAVARAIEAAHGIGAQKGKP